MIRRRMLEQLAVRVLSVGGSHPIRVAVDGIDAAGKTTLANELGAVLEESGRPVIRASIDGFHQPRSVRYRRGPESPEGYYFDSFDYLALCGALLAPLGPHGSRRYRRAVFDFRTDTALDSSEEDAPPNAILVFDGVFLLRPELDTHWEYRVLVDVPFSVAVQRAMRRDQELFGTAHDVQERYLRRYVPGQQFYFDAVCPRERAQAIVGNADPAKPILVFRA